METRADDLNQSGDLPQPGTEEPDQTTRGESTDGPGNVAVDEPTSEALEADRAPGVESEPDEDEDTSEGTSEGTSEDTSEGTSE